MNNCWHIYHVYDTMICVFIHIFYMILEKRSDFFVYSCRKRLQGNPMCHSSDQKECIENYGGFCGLIISKHEYVIRLKRSCKVTWYHCSKCRQSLIPYYHTLTGTWELSKETKCGMIEFFGNFLNELRR